MASRSTSDGRYSRGRYDLDRYDIVEVLDSVAIVTREDLWKPQVMEVIEADDNEGAPSIITISKTLR